MEVIIILTVVVSILLGVTAFNHYLWMGFAVPVAIAGCVLIEYSSKPLIWKVLVWILLVAMILNLIYALIKTIRQTYNSKVKFTYEIKYDYFSEYTY